MDNMYHSAWAWAGDSPFRYTKLIAADWGGTRTPMVISWPKRIKPDKTPRPQFTHVNDVVPTLYEILGIEPPKVVDGHKQDPIDGVSLFAVDGTLYYEYSALLLKRDKIKVGELPAGDVKIALEMRTPLERAAPAELKFWINGKAAAAGTVQRTVPLTFTAPETVDVGMDTNSPVADDYFEKAPFAFEGKLQRLHFKNLQPERPAFKRSPDDD